MGFFKPRDIVSILSVTAAYMVRCDALECYSCQFVTDASDCNTTARCNSGESCSLTSVPATGQKSNGFSMGCLGSQKCGSAAMIGSLVGKRQTANCDECCSTDLCNSGLCSHPKLHGGWTTWSDWGSCSATCDIGIQRRDRSCSNPHPSRFGDNCYGESRDDRICFQTPCANGGWSTWNSWSTCSLTCGSGLQSRERACTNPKPSVLGQNCIGSSRDTQTCNSNRCPPLVSAFSVDKPFSISQGILTFSHTIYQHGGDFNPSTGIFQCSIPGTYHFIVTLVKKRANTRVDRVYCWLYKVLSYVIFIKVNPTDDDTDKGSAAITQSAILHLNRGETVYLSNCNGAPNEYMEDWSSFTGFLLYPDT